VTDVRGRLHHVILDCSEPRVPAEFWSALLDQPVTYDSADFVVVAADGDHIGTGVPAGTGPSRPDLAVPQQIHLAVMVEDADPAGHPFCLIPRPAWAAPLPN
jgi:hypothetical protein